MIIMSSPSAAEEELFASARPLHVCAPMVRYSKLAFRTLVRLYDVHLAYTPMILADSFVRSDKARDVEFTTDPEVDAPLVVQFAASRVEDFVDAAQLVQDDCLGVGLNCGCPQRWAWKEGIGACLMHRPEFVHDLVRQTRNRCREGLSVSVKIRIHEDWKGETVDFCRSVESAGAAFVTVHGRTKDQRAEPVNLEAVRNIKQSLKIPVVANGDVRSLEDAAAVCAATGVDGVMAARGILENPAMFAGHDATPLECVERWIGLALETGTPFVTFHHHLIYMCSRILSRPDRRVFNSLSSTAAVVDYLEEKFGVGAPLPQ